MSLWEIGEKIISLEHFDSRTWGDIVRKLKVYKPKLHKHLVVWKPQGSWSEIPMGNQKETLVQVLMLFVYEIHKETWYLREQLELLKSNT